MSKATILAGMAALTLAAAVPDSDVDGELVAFAMPLVERAAAVSAVWPGFWGEEPRFIVLRDQVVALLVAPTAPAGFTEVRVPGLPSALAGRLFMRDEYPPELGPNEFSLRYVVGSDTVPALEPKGSTVFGRTEFYLHEAFHGYQRAKFTSLPEDARAVRFGEHLVDPDQLGDAFAAAADRERSFLLDALRAAPDRAEQRRLADAFLAARNARLTGRSDAAAVELRMERTEGTAKYVGCLGVGSALGAPAAAARACIAAELERPLDAMPTMPEADARLMRWRLYGTGGAMALLLDDLGAEGWQAQVEAGAALHELLRGALAADPG